MADQGRWFKLWCSAIHDPHLDNLSLEDFGRWAKLGSIIKEQGTNGKLNISAPARMLCSALQIESFSGLLEALKRLPKVAISCTNNAHGEKQKTDVTPVTNAPVTYAVEFLNWHKYQGDISRDRVRKFRAKNRQNVTPKKRGEEKRGEEKRIFKDTIVSFVEGFNKICENLPKTKETSKKREDKIKNRLKEHSLEWWLEVFRKANEVAIPKKEGGDWRPTLDWLIENDINAIKVYEGQYEKRKGVFE